MAVLLLVRRRAPDGGYFADGDRAAGFFGVLSTSIAILIGFVVFLPVFLVPPVVAGILHVIGAVKAYNGEWWNPPFTPQIVR